jgi:hypothetical protein
VVYRLELVPEASEGEGLLESALVQVVLAYLKHKIESKLFFRIEQEMSSPTFVTAKLKETPQKEDP